MNTTERDNFVKEGKPKLKFKLKEYLEEKKIPLKFIHDVTGIRYATLWNMMNEMHNSVDLRIIYQIMEAINISDVSLLFEKEDLEKTD